MSQKPPSSATSLPLPSQESSSPTVALLFLVGAEMASRRWARLDAPYGPRRGDCALHLEPQEWLSQNQKHKDAISEQLKIQNPDGFAAQEERRRFYNETKKKGNIVKTAIAMLVLAFKRFLNSENETFYEDPCDVNDDPYAGVDFCKIAIQQLQAEIYDIKNCVSTATAAVPSSKRRMIISGVTPTELVASANVFLTKGTSSRPIRGIDTLLIELCASAELELTQQVPYGCAAVRITDKEDFTNKHTVYAILAIVRLARKNQVKATVWVATPSISGCPWKHVNAAREYGTGDKALSGKLIRIAYKVCRLAYIMGGDYVWEWPERCDLWADWRVRALTSGQGCFRNVAAIAVGRTSLQDGKIVTIRKQWKLWTTHPSVASVFSSYQRDSAAGTKTFVPCSGRIAKNSVYYTKNFAGLFWKSQCGARNKQCGFLTAPPASQDSCAHYTQSLCDGHRELDSRPTMPLWCALLARVVTPKSAEARCEGAENAIKKELANMDSKKVWEVDDVYSLKDLPKHPDIPKAMLGRVLSHPVHQERVAG